MCSFDRSEETISGVKAAATHTQQALYVNTHLLVENRYNEQNQISSATLTPDRQLQPYERYLDDLKLHSLVGLRALEAVADGFHQPVDEPLAGRSAVRSVACDVAVRDQLLLGGANEQQSVMYRCGRALQSILGGGISVVLMPRHTHTHTLVFLTLV